MITFKTGDLLADDADALVNTVNCVGVMGKGIALQFKQRWPAMFADYRQRCSRGTVQPGLMDIHTIGEMRYVINFPTKLHWRDPSRLSWIRDGLQALAVAATWLRIQSLAVPALGCNNGGLAWTTVRPLMVHALEPLPIDVRIYEPQEGAR